MEFIETGKHLAARLLIKSLYPRKHSKILDYSALTHCNFAKDTVLTLALKNVHDGCEETIKILLATNFLPQLVMPDGNNDTPLMLAIKRGNITIISHILEKAIYGAQLFEGINNDGFTALMLAVILGRLDIVTLIISNPAFTLTLFQQMNPQNETAFTLARHSPSIQKALQDYEDNSNKQEYMPAMNALDLIARLNTNVREWSDSSLNGEHAISSDTDASESPSIGPSVSRIGMSILSADQ